MKITNIKPQVKRQDRYSVYVDDKYLFSLSASELLNQGLRIGQEFDQLGIDDVLKSAEKDKAYSRSLDLLSRRPRSTWEIREYLKNKGYNDNIIEITLNRLSKNRYIDDKQFAISWINSRQQVKPSSKRRIIQELRQKHVSDQDISSAFSGIDFDENEQLRKIVAKKANQTKYQDSTKLTAYLMRQGFSYENIKTCLS